MEAEQLLKEKYNLEMPEPAKPVGLYAPVVQTGNLIFVSGQMPTRDGQLLYKGVVGKDLTIEEGQVAARLAALNCLALIKGHIGDLDKIKKVVQVVGYVRSSENFGDQPAVLNGASKLFIDLFGERGRHSRVALGTSELPGGTPVEVMCVVEV